MTNRAGVADAAQQYKDTLLRPDDGRPEDMYSKIVEIDLTTLEPHLSMLCGAAWAAGYTCIYAARRTFVHHQVYGTILLEDMLRGSAS
jgi:hypothetical protein